jgi:two-component system sensor histidine kinase UhpB
LLERSDEGEFIGKPFLEFVYKDDRAGVSENYRHRLADKSIPETFTCRIVTPSGVAKWVEINITYISWEGKPAHLNFLKDISDRKSSEVELLNMKESLENLTKHLDDIRENERIQISREFHDEFSQTLTVFKMDIKWLISKVVRGSEEETKLQEMLQLVNTNEDVVQRITSELRSPIMDDLGLASSLEWYCNGFEKRSGLQISMELDEVQSVNTNNNLVIYRVLQESLTNIVRHAYAKKIHVKLGKKGNVIVLTVQDDGIGIPHEKIKSSNSLGLIGMNERVRQTGGHMEITTPNKGGTKIIAYIPE